MSFWIWSNWTQGLWSLEFVQQMTEFVELWDFVQEVKLVEQDNTLCKISVASAV